MHDQDNTVDKHNLSKEIVSLIKQKIISGIWNPGERIVETKLARELGISQTPIREAIRQLAGENVVELIPNRGPVIRDITAKDAFEIYSYRSIMEGMAIRLAVQNATIKDIKHLEQFYSDMKHKLQDDAIPSLSDDSSYIHYYIFMLSKHSLLIEHYDYISFRVKLVNRILGRKFTKEREVEEHAELIEALKNGDPDEAEKVMREHIRRAYVQFMDSGLFDRKELVPNEWI